MSETVEIKTIASVNGFGTLMGAVDIIPDPSVEPGYKRTNNLEPVGMRIFISPMNYEYFKGLDAKGTITALSLLIET